MKRIDIIIYFFYTVMVSLFLFTTVAELYNYIQEDYIKLWPDNYTQFTNVTIYRKYSQTFNPGTDSGSCSLDLYFA